MTLGSISAETPGITAASMSGTASSSGRLMRTTTSAPSCATRGTAAAIAARASAFLAGMIESSRSRIKASAPRVWALAMKRSASTGTNISERQLGVG